MIADGRRALCDVLSAFGLTARPDAGSLSAVEVVVPSGAPCRVEVFAVAVATTGLAERLRDEAVKGPVVVVADRISAPVRAELTGAGVGWFDRRGHLRLVEGGVFIDADVSADGRPAIGRPTGSAVRGRAGLAAAFALLLRAGDPLSLSEIARFAGLNASSLTRALVALAESQLVEPVGRGRYRPLIPELFWALSEVWPRDHAVVNVPLQTLDDSRLPVGDDLALPGWVVGGARGAVSWGAPLVLSGDYPAKVYVPDAATLRTAMVLLERPAESRSGSRSGPRRGSMSRSRSDNEASLQKVMAVALDPTGLVTRFRYRHGDQRLALAHPLVCALDISHAARDREALDRWTPPEGFERVW